MLDLRRRDLVLTLPLGRRAHSTIQHSHLRAVIKTVAQKEETHVRKVFGQWRHSTTADKLDNSQKMRGANRMCNVLRFWRTSKLRISWHRFVSHALRVSHKQINAERSTTLIMRMCEHHDRYARIERGHLGGREGG